MFIVPTFVVKVTNTEPDVSIGWLVIIEHMESVAGALLVVYVGVLDAMGLTIQDSFKTTKSSIVP